MPIVRRAGDTIDALKYVPEKGKMIGNGGRNIAKMSMAHRDGDIVGQRDRKIWLYFYQKKIMGSLLLKTESHIYFPTSY